MSIAVVTFDLDNTLWDVEPVLERAEAAQWAWLRAQRPAALENLDDQALLALRRQMWRQYSAEAHDVGAMRRHFLDAVQRRGGYSDSEVTAGTETAFSLFLAERQQVDLYDQALPVLTTLRARYRLGVLSNGNADIHRTAAGSCFEFVLLAGQVGASKPDAALFEAAVQAGGVPAEAIVHVGDHPEHDIDGARRAGLRTVWMNNRGKRWDDEASGLAPADAEIGCLSELPSVIAGLAGR